MRIYELKRKIKSNRILYLLYIFFYAPIRQIKQKKLARLHYKEFNSNFSRLNRIDKKILYIGIPLHPNLGDQAQYFCTLKWLNKNYTGLEILEVPDCLIITNYKKCLQKLKTIITSDDIIIFQSGYRTSDIGNVGGEYAHRIISSTFIENKILVLPQTVNFKNKFEFNKSRDCYAMNKNVLFLARDSYSYKMASQEYKNRVMLFPDIVTTLIGNYDFNIERNGLLFCIRNDTEKLYTDNEIDYLINKYKDKMNVLKTDTTIDITYKELRDHLKDVIENKINEFSKFNVIITDRYHGTIFGLISQTPTIVLSSSDHKVSSGVDWFKNRQEFQDYIYFADNLKEADRKINTILCKKERKKISNVFEKEYYEKLKEIFENA